MQTDRSWRYFIGAVVLLILVAAGVAFWRQRALNYRLEDTPDAVVFNYVLAVQRKDAPMLATLMVQDEEHPTLTEIQQALSSGALSLNGVSVRLGEVTIRDDEAWVELVMWAAGDEPLGDGYRFVELAYLVREDGRWKVKRMPYSLWSWEWDRYRETVP